MKHLGNSISRAAS
ncbi:hypothetical protein FSI61_003745 [Escherichia coli]|nr:hypothetical protein [Escherichia coli]EIM2892693.1 hypothetical protein [Escherichia coli]MBB9856881.1 hypothetical protein [Escherichia coli]